MGLTAEAWARVRVVSWDVDGTLYAMSDFRRALRGLVVRRVLGLRWAGVWRAARALRRQRVVLEQGRTGPLDASLWSDPAYLELERDWLVPAVAAAGPRPEVVRLIDALAPRRQVVLSDLRAAEKLDALGLAGRFTHVFAGQDLGVIKPNPAFFRHALDALALEPAELLHVGDRTDTDGGATALGITFVQADDLASLENLLAPA